MTRVVHGTFVLELHGTRLLLDPWFHAGMLTNQDEPLGLMPGALPALAAVLVTGDAFDRFDDAALHDLATTVPRAVPPPALRERLLAPGLHEVTCLARLAHTSVHGVTVTAPCPIATEIVSPAYHFSLNVFCFHSVDGTRLSTSPGRSMPVFPTRPNIRAYLLIRSTPSRSPTL